MGSDSIACPTITDTSEEVFLFNFLFIFEENEEGREGFFRRSALKGGGR